MLFILLVICASVCSAIAGLVGGVVAAFGVAERKISKGLPKEIIYDYTVGSVSRDRMDLIGRSFVGQEATALTEEGKQFFISSDKLRQYRPPEIKAGGQLRANLQERLKPSGAFITNGHFDIVD